MSTPSELELPRELTAARIARQHLTERFGAHLDPSELDAAKLLVSELVNNAVRHGRGRIMLRALADDNRLRVDVIDEGSGFEHALRRFDLEEVGGRGLGIVDTYASRWGVYEGTTHVWFEVERAGPRLGPA